MIPRYNRFFTPVRSFWYRPNFLPRNFNWGNFLSNAGKTLNVINQAIPVFYQVKPVFSNIRTMFKIANEVRKPDIPNVNNNVNDEAKLKNPVLFR